MISSVRRSSTEGTLPTQSQQCRSVVTETVFAWPGIGCLAIQGIYNRDYPLVQASVFVAAVFFVGISFLVDLLYTLLNPRICYE